jgi:hypothetical protein
MTSSATHNDQIPTDPTRLVGLLLLAAAVVGQLNPDQTEAVTAVFSFAAAINPFLPRGGR